MTKWTDMNDCAGETEEIDEPYLNRGGQSRALQSPAEHLHVEAGRSMAEARRPEQSRGAFPFSFPSVPPPSGARGSV